MLVAKPLNKEPDLLKGNEMKQLRFVSLDNQVVIGETQAPSGGWTHQLLEASTLPTNEPWNAFLGQTWIGSSEV